MKGKEIKGRTRIRCPLCGSMAWQSQFEKEKPLLKMFTQWSPAFRKFKYQENTDIGMLQRLHGYLIEKVEALYERLTGINIRQLMARAGGDKEWQKSRYASIVPVSSISTSKMEDLSTRRKINVTPTGNLRKTGTKIIIQ